MGHKVNPKGFRIGPLFSWDSRWFADARQYKEFVFEDEILRKMLNSKLRSAGIVKVEIERSINTITVILNVVRPGLVIGRGGQNLEELKKNILKTLTDHRKKEKRGKSQNIKLELKVEPVKQPNLSAVFIGNQIAEQLAKRLPHKRVVGMAVDKVMTSGAKGVKILLSGRIAGAEIARRETYKKGTIPLSTLRENIDFASSPSLTKSGYIGVKVWICK